MPPTFGTFCFIHVAIHYNAEFSNQTSTASENTENIPKGCQLFVTINVEGSWSKICM